MGKKRKYRRLLWVAAILSLLAGGHLIFSPFLNNWTKKRNEILELRAKLDRDQARVEQKALWQTRMTEIRRRQLPVDPSGAESLIMGEISLAAKKSGLDITLLRPVWENIGGSQQRTIRLRLTGIGEISAIQGFLLAVETSELPLYIQSLEIRSPEDRGVRLEINTDISAVLMSAKQEDA